MQYAGVIKLSILSAALGLFFTLTLPLFEAQQALATAEIAKGQPCKNCHTGSPPTKKDLKKK